MNQTIFTLIPFLYFFTFALFLYQPLLKILNGQKLLGFSTSLLLSPLITSLVYHFNIYFFPSKQDSFYILILSLFLILYSIFSFAFFGPPKFLPLPKFIFATSSISKILVVINLIIITTTIIRTVFWPTNWDDQILYLRQSYVYHQTQSAHPFYQLSEFKNDQIEYTMNTSIRPALPLIFSFAFFFTDSITTSQYYCQTIIIWFLLSLLGIVYSITKSIFDQNNTTPHLALFFILTCYYFINFSIYGYKEPALMSLTLLSLFLVYNSRSQKHPSILNPIFLGVTTGLSCFINYSGSVLSFIIILLYFIYFNKNFISKIIHILILTASLLFFSFFEPLIFVHWAIDGIVPINNTAINNNTKPPSQQNQDFVADTRTTIVKHQESNKAELSGYKIQKNSKWEYLLKGKLQGLTQIQYYGLIFIFLSILIVTQLKSILAFPFNRLLLLFLLFYIFIFLDPLNLNPNMYSYVLNISPKYTLMLVPIAAIIIASQYQTINALVNKIPKITFLILFFLLGLVSIWIILDNHFVFSQISYFVPLYRENLYYIEKIKSFGYLFLPFATLSFIYLLITKSNIIFLFTIIIPFALIFAFPYNSNFGFINTYKYMFSGLDIKLENIKSDQDYYKNLNFLNQKIAKEPASIKIHTCKVNGNPVLMYANYSSVNQLIINQCQISNPINDNGFYFSQTNGLEISPKLSAKVKLLFTQGNYGIYQLTNRSTD